jgi:rhodanese-related sulfurtransferase
MKTLLTWPLILLLCTCTLAATAQTAQPAANSKVHVLNRAEFDAWLAKPEQLLIVDVRRPDEVTAVGGLPVFLSVQLSDLEQHLAWIPQGRSIVTVSNHASRGARAAELLIAHGFKVAGTLGVQNYEEQGGTLTKIAPKPAAPAIRK